jgi:hypothetical protein
VTKNLLIALLTLTSGAALAQTAETQPAASTQAPAKTAPAQPTTEPAAESPAAPSVEDRLTTAEGKVAALEEQNIETKNDLSALKKLKLSSYVQARYTAQQSLDETGAGGFNRFSVRRGRIKATYTGDLAQFMLQIDAVPSGVALRDAEATLFIPGTQQNLSVSIGQFKWPFGFEGPQSSSDREFPERTSVVRAFLPGERDRGVRFSGKFLGLLRVSAGIFDGNGTNNTGFIGTDNDKEKDLIGRVGFDKKWIAGGVSGWFGNTLGKRTTGPNPDEGRKAYSRNRMGADLQLYLDLLPVGGTALKGEYITGSTYQRGGVEQFGVAAHGWWAMAVQNIGLSNQVAIRYDSFDPQNSSEASESDGKLGANNPINTLGLTAIHHLSENLKVSATYELPITATAGSSTVEDPKDNVFTVQFQARF